jgi:RNA polymerase sigma-70 factor (ECF subfamily)
MDAINKLPVGYRTIVQLYLIEDMPQEEIATLLGIAHGTVRSQYSRAKKQILKFIQHEQSNG